jgi:hypothetical protein
MYRPAPWKSWRRTILVRTRSSNAVRIDLSPQRTSAVAARMPNSSERTTSVISGLPRGHLPASPKWENDRREKWTYEGLVRLDTGFRGCRTGCWRWDVQACSSASCTRGRANGEEGGCLGMQWIVDGRGHSQVRFLESLVVVELNLDLVDGFLRDKGFLGGGISTRRPTRDRIACGCIFR